MESVKHKYIECGAFKGKGIAVFTSGGDAQGMNAAIRAVVRMGIYLGCRVYFVREGYQGLVEGGANIFDATWSSVSGIISKGGTVIGSARCQEFREKSGRLKAAKNLIKKGVTNLVVIGGDGSLTGANLFKQEWPALIKELHENGEITGDQVVKFSSLSIVGMVGSIDNDFWGTDMTIGTDSALHRIIEAADATYATAQSHQRCFVIEVMGRHCGYLALVTAITTEADYVFFPESPPPADWPEQVSALVKQARSTGQRNSTIIVAEGAIDVNGDPLKVQQIKDIIEERTGMDTRVTVLGHIQRGGQPSAFDRIIGCRMGAEAVIALMHSKPYSPALVITLEGNQVISLPLLKCVQMTKAVSDAMAKKDYERAVELRGKSFRRNLSVFKMLNQIKPLSQTKSEVNKNFAILHIGAPSCGMNPCVRSFVRSSLVNGYTIYGIHDGIDGLLNGSFQQMVWGDVSGWSAEGGALLGTKRTLARDKLEQVSKKLQQYAINGLLLIGGFESYLTALQLYKARDEFDEFNIPILVIPASISNNVPGTDVTLGCDTALNEITEICDRIRQSAQGTKRRVFIVETMGGYCGYLATLAGLAGGADAAYIFEEKFSIKDLQKDVYHMASKMAEGIQRGLILRNEKCNEHYNIDFMHRLYSEEGKGVFTARMNIIGHMQQGGSPTPFDRNMGTKFGLEAAKWFDKASSSGPESACVLGLQKRTYTFTNLEKLESETLFPLRLPKKQWWLKLRPLLRILAQHDSVYEEEGILLMHEEGPDQERPIRSKLESTLSEGQIVDKLDPNIKLPDNIRLKTEPPEEIPSPAKEEAQKLEDPSVIKTKRSVMIMEENNEDKQP